MKRLVARPVAPVLPAAHTQLRYKSGKNRRDAAPGPRITTRSSGRWRSARQLSAAHIGGSAPPWFGERTHRLLIAIAADSRSHGCSVLPSSRRTYFRTRPTGFFGSSSRNSMYLGTAKYGNLSMDHVHSSASVSVEPATSTAVTFTSSSVTSEWTAWTATSEMSGWPRNAVSISKEEMFSPRRPLRGDPNPARLASRHFVVVFVEHANVEIVVQPARRSRWRRLVERVV